MRSRRRRTGRCGRSLARLRERDQGQRLFAGLFAFAVGFVLLLYGTGIPAVIDYQKHPSHKPLFIAALAFDLLLFVAFMIWGTRWWWLQRNATEKKPT